MTIDKEGEGEEQKKEEEGATKRVMNRYIRRQMRAPPPLLLLPPRKNPVGRLSVKRERRGRSRRHHRFALRSAVGIEPGALLCL